MLQGNDWYIKLKPIILSDTVLNGCSHQLQQTQAYKQDNADHTQ